MRTTTIDATVAIVNEPAVASIPRLYVHIARKYPTSIWNINVNQPHFVPCSLNAVAIATRHGALNMLNSMKLSPVHLFPSNRFCIATITSSSPKGKSLITTDMYYDITCDEKDLDLVFLVAFAIAKTEQIIYD